MTDQRDHAGTWADWQERSRHLDTLANALRPFGLLVRQGGPVPQLHVSDPVRTRNCESVVVSKDDHGAWWYWWAHAERIAPVDDLEEAARPVARVVSAVTG